MADERKVNPLIINSQACFVLRARHLDTFLVVRDTVMAHISTEIFAYRKVCINLH